jgi:hypothetical protein
MESPQGSIFGPLLFLLYINDLPSGMHPDSKLILYADDTSILITGKTLYAVHRKSVTTIKYITKWFSVNGLLLNMDKTKIIQFDLSHSQPVSFQISWYASKQAHELEDTHWSDNSKIKQCMLCN